MMKVVHVITRLIVGGAQENTLLTVEDQHCDYGDEVTLLTGPALGPEGSLLERAAKSAFRLQIVDSLRRSIHPLRDAAAYRDLRAAFRDLKPDLVHTHSSKAGILGRAAAAALGIPVVHTIHGAAFHHGQSRITHSAYIMAERWAAARTDHFISVADAMTHEYVSHGVAEAEKFTTIYSGFEVEPFLSPPRPPDAVRRDLGFTDEHIVVGKVGRLFHLKGHEFVIAAAKQVVARLPQVRFLFVGDGILRARYEREIAQAKLTPHFVFTGLVPPDVVPELLHATDLVVHTSQWEGLARVLPQALIAGKPVISYDVGGAREVVIPEQTGFLLPRDSVDELAQAILCLAGDPEMRRRLGQTGRERFAEQFRHETMTRAIREVYRDVLAARGLLPQSEKQPS